MFAPQFWWPSKCVITFWRLDDVIRNGRWGFETSPRTSSVSIWWENRDFISLLLRSLWWVQIVGHVLACRSYSFGVHYTISLSTLSEDAELTKRPVKYTLSSVWIRLSIFSQSSIIQYMGLCVFSLPISFVMIETIYIRCLIIIKLEVWTNILCLGLNHETMVYVHVSLWSYGHSGIIYVS